MTERAFKNEEDRLEREQFTSSRNLEGAHPNPLEEISGNPPNQLMNLCPKNFESKDDRTVMRYQSGLLLSLGYHWHSHSSLLFVYSILFLFSALFFS